MKKKLVSLAMVFVLMLALVPTAGAATEERLAPNGVYMLELDSYILLSGIGQGDRSTATLTIDQNGQKMTIYFHDDYLDYVLDFLFEEVVLDNGTVQKRYVCKSVNGIDDVFGWHENEPGHIPYAEYFEDNEHWGFPGKGIDISCDTYVRYTDPVYGYIDFMIVGYWVPVSKPIINPVIEAIDTLVEKGVIGIPDYWYVHYDDIEYLDQLIINLASLNYSNSSTWPASADDAIDRLGAAGAISNTGYWKVNYSLVHNLDSLLIKAASML